ncbi:MAG TPA: efflux RND transporter periplasmic adaptor subunit [Paraburkholderia sp.]|nr:efflux RND transporter periplasmic adaptor subunit [Paraburkholderia sp.]
MPFSKSTAFVGAVVIGVALGLSVFLLVRSANTIEASAEGNSPAMGQTPGEHGGTLLTSGDLAMEVVLSEKADDTRLIVYPYAKGQPITQGVAVSGTLTHFSGASQQLRFNESNGGFESLQSIAKPHVFDAELQLAWQGRTALFGYSRSDGAVALSPGQTGAAGIGLATAGPAQIGQTIQVPGEIRFNEDLTAHVVPRVAGVVERVSVSVGQKVEKGQLLAVIASTDLSDRRSELLTAERRLSAARTTYQREKTLWQERISAEQDYLQAQVQLREAEIAAQNARQKLLALNVTGNAGPLNRYELRAPFAGTIIEKHATAGEAIAADAKVFTLSDLSSVWAEMAVPPQQLDVVRVGREALVKATAFDSASSGRVTYVGSLLGEQTRSAPARVVLPNPDGAWRPGMFVSVSVDAGRQNVPVAVAVDALQEIDGSLVVFAKSPKGFVPVGVKTGVKDARFVQIVSGLNAGQQYVAANSFALKAELGKGSAEE